ncbi:SDR family oxidoreductase [Pelagicoccus sp. NFK12]|uniref:SDR family oxidoreductase n=1 Tax=Pelagicoccus enzymogenes TaxID=2773457 RepID=A0A927FAP0_9BACT|nr:SDR family oxidoreductase [Pelagicoccus enzymogenes]MBD5781404.1 SDR family oxidoreductase [Pelagicoccus enzymogenes]MDQ8199178.1 SDR family oxidoreductase [Pelagicoccus enzymogenes]
MKILVTGSCGYVGTRLVPSLLEQGHQVVGVDTMWFGNFLEDHPQLTLLEADVRNIDDIPMDGVDAVIHLANIANDPCSDLNSKLNWEVNALATKFLVEKAIDSGAKQFIFASSGSVYGVKEEPEVTEDLSLVPISDYNKTKMVSERVLLSYADEIAIQIIRPATVCGYSPRMRLDLSVNILTMLAVTNGNITVFGGDQTRPNIHILDMIGVYHHFLAHPEFTGIYNAGFENLSIMEIAERAAAKTEAKITVTPSNDPRSYRLSSKKLLATGFVQKYGVDTAIDEVIELFKDGTLENKDEFHNIKAMKKLGLDKGA